jgi:hypothetical protein
VKLSRARLLLYALGLWSIALFFLFLYPFWLLEMKLRGLPSRDAQLGN